MFVKRVHKKLLPIQLLMACLMICPLPAIFAAHQTPTNIVMKALKEELQRATETLDKRGEPPPYFISYQVTDTDYSIVSASYGALRVNTSNRLRLLDVDVRVGSYQLDSTHQIASEDERSPFSGYSAPVNMPVEDDLDALKSTIWLKTDEKYKAAVERLIKVKTDRAVKIRGEARLDDFSREAPQLTNLPLATFRPNTSEWEAKVKELSAGFKKYPEIHSSVVLLSNETTNKYFVNSEGASIQQGATTIQLSIIATIKADDGMDLFRFETFNASTPDALPQLSVVQQSVDKLGRDLLALRKAPVIEPYTGPAILSGRASGVFFHEIFGHRIEGSRLKRVEDGNTFVKRLNQPVLPQFISVFDDPTIERMLGADLNGHYQYDDEGTKAQRVTVVENGILKNFLMSRAPVARFEKSNGHGRKSPGFAVAGRQSNLIVQASRTVPNARLRAMLIAECRRQGKRYGLLFEDVAGGFTNTAQGTPQAYQITPIMVYRVYTDGRPDELVRGVELIGTPLTSFSKIIASGDQPEVFNGACNAESGLIPVSAVAPSLLIGQVEVQRKQQSSERGPILPPPGMDKEKTDANLRGKQ